MEEKGASKQTSTKKETGVTFKCNVCGQHKPLKDMMTITRFFPIIIACRDCERKMQ